MNHERRVQSIIKAFVITALSVFVLLLSLLFVFRDWFGVLIGLLGLGLIGVMFDFLGLALKIKWAMKRGLTPEKAWRLRTKLIKRYPLVLFLLRGFMGQEVLSDGLISINNHLLDQMVIKVPFDKILVLSPHCLQKGTCPYKVTGDLHACHVCGQCPVGDLKNLTERYGVRVVIASGGTLARKAILDQRPLCVVAVACRRDLTSGILDMPQVPVFAFENLQPNGACYQTDVDVTLLVKLIEKIGE